MNEAEKTAEEIRREQLEADVKRLSDLVASLTGELSKVKRNLADLKEDIEQVADDVEELDDDGDSSSSIAGARDDDEDDVPGSALPPHAYQVITTPDGKVLCLLPKDPNGTYFPAAQGGKHLGASTGETADEHAGPYPAGGEGSGSDEPAPWAHYGWYEVGEMEVGSDSDSDVNDKIVLATYTVPLDPIDGSDSDSDEPTEGPKLTSISLVDADDWQDICARSWIEHDNHGAGFVTRQVAIALVANGLVTQLTMTPFLDTHGAGDDWHADSEGKIYYSIDPPSKVPEYETEEVDQEKTVVVGTDILGQPMTRTVTVKVTRVKKDPQTGNPIQKTDQQGNPVFSKTKYHQVHNFDSGNDNGLIEYADDQNYGGTPVACRITNGKGSAELMWRRIPRPPAPSCPPSYELDEQTGSGCTEKTIVLKKTEYTPNSSGGCTAGTPEIVGGGVAIPKPPTYELAETQDSTSCMRKWQLTQTPCGGSASPVGSAVIQIPGKDTISASATGSSAGGALAGTVYITPCGGSQVSIPIYNGSDGQSGCTPAVSATVDGTTTSAGRVKAGSVTITPCGGTATTIDIWNGKDGEDGSDGDCGDCCAPEIYTYGGVTLYENDSHLVKMAKVKGAYLLQDGSCDRDVNWTVLSIPKKNYTSFLLRPAASGDGLDLVANIYVYSSGSNSFIEDQEIINISADDLATSLSGVTKDFEFYDDFSVSGNRLVARKNTLSFRGGLLTSWTQLTGQTVLNLTAC